MKEIHAINTEYAGQQDWTGTEQNMERVQAHDKARTEVGGGYKTQTKAKIMMEKINLT